MVPSPRLCRTAQTAARLRERMTTSRNSVARQKGDNEGLEGQRMSEAKDLAQVITTSRQKKGPEKKGFPASSSSPFLQW